jgi:hypothetical protein
MGDSEDLDIRRKLSIGNCKRKSSQKKLASTVIAFRPAMRGHGDFCDGVVEIC